MIRFQIAGSNGFGFLGSTHMSDFIPIDLDTLEASTVLLWAIGQAVPELMVSENTFLPTQDLIISTDKVKIIKEKLQQFTEHIINDHYPAYQEKRKHRLATKRSKKIIQVLGKEIWIDQTRIHSGIDRELELLGACLASFDIAIADQAQLHFFLYKETLDDFGRELMGLLRSQSNAMEITQLEQHFAGREKKLAKAMKMFIKNAYAEIVEGKFQLTLKGRCY